LVGFAQIVLVLRPLNNSDFEDEDEDEMNQINSQIYTLRLNRLPSFHHSIIPLFHYSECGAAH